MRSLRIVASGTALLLRGQNQRRDFGASSNRTFGGPRDRGPAVRQPPPMRAQANRGHRGAPPRPNEPQLVAKLLELFPSDKSWVPVNKWAQSMPDDVREVLVAYGGLGTFTAAQSNFFIVRSENGVKVVSLSTLGSNLCRERVRKEKLDRKRSEQVQRFGQRKHHSAPRGHRQQRIQ